MGLYQMLSVMTLVAFTAVGPAHSDTPPQIGRAHV